MERQAPKTAEEFIRAAGLRCTAPRVLVLGRLMRAREPLSIDDLEKRLKGKVNIVTIYRILREFTKHNLTYQTNFHTGKAFFEFQHTHHHHIICTECGRREDVTIPDLDRKLTDTAQSQSRFSRVSHHTLEFFGVCRACAA